MIVVDKDNGYIVFIVFLSCCSIPLQSTPFNSENILLGVKKIRIHCIASYPAIKQLPAKWGITKIPALKMKITRCSDWVIAKLFDDLATTKS